MGIKIEKSQEKRGGRAIRRNERSSGNGDSLADRTGYSDRNPDSYHEFYEPAVPLSEDELQKVADGELSSVIVSNDTLRKLIRSKYNLKQDQESAVRALYKKIPTNARLAIENLFGVDDVITAADFTEDELVEMLLLGRRQQDQNKFQEETLREIIADPSLHSGTTEEAKAKLATYTDTRGKTSVNPYRYGLVDENYADAAFKSFVSPEYTVATSLGKYNVFDSPTSTAARIEDNYNFNQQERDRPTDFFSVLYNSIRSPELAGEYVANFFGTEDREVDIRIPKKVGMNEGGTVTSMNRKKYTTDEYQSSFIDYYGGFGGIDVSLAPDPDPDPDPDPPTAPNILDSGYNQDDGAAGTNLGASAYLPGTAITPINYQQYLDAMADGNDAKTKQGMDKSLGGFSDFVEKSKDLGILSVGLPQPLGAVAAVGGALYRKYTTQNLNAIASTGGTGGGAFKLGPRVVTRAPGERVYTGAEGNVANAAEGIQYGFIPRTWSETEQTNPSASGTYVKTGKTGLIVSADKQSIMDPFGNYHHISGVQGAGGSRDMRENLLKNAIENAGISTAGIDIRGDSVNLMMALNAHMSGKIGAFTTVRGMGTSEYNRALKDAQDFIADYATRMYGSGTTEDDGGTAGAGAGTRPRSVIDSARMAGINAGPATSSRAASSAIVQATLESAAQRYRDSGQQAADEARRQEEFQPVYDPSQVRKEEKALQQDPGMFGDDDPSPAGTPTEYSMTAEEAQDYADSYADVTDYSYFKQGGRVGMQMGGTAPQAAPAGFVERPPSQVSEAATVADDKPMSVPEGTFVINAAAVEFAGEGDIAKMLNDAYKKAGKKGAAAPSKDQVDVAVSRGEVLVPPAIAKIIGYDRLEKINNRGKKETKDRIKENGQRPVKAARGGFINR
jgi:hypothetical protein